MGKCTLFARLLVYQVVFLSIYHGITNVQKSSSEFKDKFYSLDRWSKQSFGQTLFLHPKIEELLSTNSELFYQIYLAKLGFFAFFGLLGFKFGAWTVALLRVGHIMLYLNPFLAENRITFPYGISTELLLHVGVILAVFMTSTNFCGSSCTPSQVDELSKDSSRDNAPNSGNKKKKHI